MVMVYHAALRILPAPGSQGPRETIVTAMLITSFIEVNDHRAKLVRVAADFSLSARWQDLWTRRVTRPMREQRREPGRGTLLDSRTEPDHVASRGVGKTTRTHELFDERPSTAAGGAHGASSAGIDAQLEAHGPGVALEAGLKHELETETGYRLDNVRIHVGGPTAKLLADHGKRGAAKGRHILLAEGAYAPDSADGKRLIRHELNHVIQQAHGKVSSDLDPHHRAGLEAEADQAPAHHGGPELRDLSPPETGPAQFMFMDGGGGAPRHAAAPAHHAAAPVHHAPVTHTAPPVGDDHWNDAKRAQAPAPARHAAPPAHHAPAPARHAPAPVRHPPPPVRHAPVYHPSPVGDDHWNDAKRAHAPAPHPAAHHAPAAPVHHTAPPVGDDHWNDAKRAHAAPVHHTAPPVGDDHWNDAKRAHAAPAHHTAPPVGDDHWNDAKRAHAAPAHHTAPPHAASPVGDTHWNDPNLRGAHIEAEAERAARRGGGGLPIVGPALGGVARDQFVSHLSRRDRADLAAYEHSEHLVHDGVAAVRHHQDAERRAADAKHHHSPFSLHTITSAGGSALHAGEDLGGKAVHAVVHAPGTIKDAATGAYHHPLEAGRALLDAVGVDTDDLASSIHDIKHGHIKHLVNERLKTAAGQLMISHGAPVVIPAKGKEARQVFDDYARGDTQAAHRDELKAQIHTAIEAVLLLPPAKAGKALEALGALSKLSKLGKLSKVEKAADAETRAADGVAHVHPHGDAAHGDAAHGDAAHGDAAHGDANHGDANHGDANHGDANHDDANHGDADHGDADHGEAPHDEAPHEARHPHKAKHPHEAPHAEAPHAEPHARETPQPHEPPPREAGGGSPGSDHPRGGDAHGKAPSRTIGNEPGGLPATQKVRAALDRAGKILRDGLGLKSADQAGRDAEQKAKKKILDARVKGGSRKEKSAIRRAARDAGKAAKRQATGQLRERQALVVEKVLDLAENLGVKLPPATKDLVSAAIKNWDVTAPYVRARVDELTRKPRTVLREIFEVWKNPG
jgi:hypothetical protein